MKKVALYNLGCKVNSYETEGMRQSLLQKGYSGKRDIGLCHSERRRISILSIPVRSPILRTGKAGRCFIGQGR